MNPLRCRLLGHAWEFGVDGREVVWICARCEGAGGRRQYADTAQARRHAAYFNRARPKPPGAFLAAFGGLLPQRGRQDLYDSSSTRRPKAK